MLSIVYLFTLILKNVNKQLTCGIPVVGDVVVVAIESTEIEVAIVH